MTEVTPLDRAHAAMAGAPDDPAPRMRFYGTLAASELFVLLEREAESDRIEPQVFELDDGPVVLAFDRETRLTAFTGAPSPYAALPGRALAGLLAGRGLGVGINFGAEAAELLPANAVEWWAATLAPAPAETTLKPEEITAPADVPEAVLTSLDACLSAAAGLARGAWLGGLRHDGRAEHLLAFLDAAPGAETVLARAVTETLRFSGLDEGVLTLVFVTSDTPLAACFDRVGLRIELPLPVPETVVRTDPDAPPILR